VSPRRRETLFRCSECGAATPKWLGRCPECGAWNTLLEERSVRARASIPSRRAGAAELPSLSGVSLETETRRLTGLAELDRVLGGGLVPGALVLLGGEPGIGKSTLALQAASGLSAGGEILYVAAEESGRQLRLRADRLGIAGEGIRVLAETSLEETVAVLEAAPPLAVVIDSIQALRAYALDSPAGTVSQVREVAGRLLPVAKGREVAVLLVGHVNKEGLLAGPKALEHAVDVVLELQGDRHHAHRILRAVKNRFGPAGELAVLRMSDGGLEEIPDPSGRLLEERPRGACGSSVTCCVEGSRCLLVEVQALVGPPSGATPRRSALGVDPGRVALILAVLERRAGLRLADREVFVSAVGGFSLREPAADLAVAASVASALADRPLDPDAVVFGEIGLAGEVRRVGRARPRLVEGRRHGFRRALLPRGNRGEGEGVELELIGVRSLREAIERLGPGPG
jgi:DNA repair protein RadA/Sms